MSLEQGARSGERYAFKISEFCVTHRISRGKFYQLRDKGLAPRISIIDGVQLITAEDAATWRREIAEASNPPAPKPAPSPAADTSSV